MGGREEKGKEGRILILTGYKCITPGVIRIKNGKDTEYISWIPSLWKQWFKDVLGNKTKSEAKTDLCWVT